MTEIEALAERLAREEYLTTEARNRIAAALALLPPDPAPDFDEAGQFFGFGKATGHTTLGPDRALNSNGWLCSPDKRCSECSPSPLVVALRAALTGEGQVESTCICHPHLIGAVPGCPRHNPLGRLTGGFKP